jgi:hypothetical protein
MTIHKQILDWQAANPNLTWAIWIVVWVGVLAALFYPAC